MEDENDVEKKTDTKPSLAEEAAAAAKAAAAAAADVAKASQEMLSSKTEGVIVILYTLIILTYSSLHRVYLKLFLLLLSFSLWIPYLMSNTFSIAAPCFILGTERRYFGELMSLLDVQVQEMKSMSNSIRKLEGTGKILCDPTSAFEYLFCLHHHLYASLTSFGFLFVISNLMIS